MEFWVTGKQSNTVNDDEDQNAYFNDIEISQKIDKLNLSKYQ